MSTRREFLKTASLVPLVARGAAVHTQPRAEADYVIVGAGSAGCVLAYRLSADPSVRVMVLEAGASAEADPAVTTPGRWVSLLGSQYDWAFRTEPMAGMDNRALAFPRGKALGGSSAINAMTFIRGDRRCFDRWRDLGNPGWGYDDVLPLFKRLEKNETGASEYRGADGPLAVSGCYDPHAGASRVPDGRRSHRVPVRRALRLQPPHSARRGRLLPEEPPRRAAPQRGGGFPRPRARTAEPDGSLRRGGHEAPCRGHTRRRAWNTCATVNAKLFGPRAK